MDVRQLRYAAALAEAGHFGRAAASLGITQPSLSRQIAQLEADVGVNLFQRDRTGVKPTAAGLVLVAAAEDVTVLLDRALAESQRAERGETGSLRIGFIGSAMHEVLLTVLPRVRSANPNIEVTVTEMATNSVWRTLADGDLDVGFGRGVPDRELYGSVRAAPVHRGHLAVMMARGHPLAGQPTVSIGQLAAHPLVIAHDSDEPASLATAGPVLAVSRLQKRTNIVTRDIRSMASLVAAGLGVGLGPNSMRALETRDIWVADIAPRVAMPHLYVGVAAPPHIPTVDVFLDALAETLPRERRTLAKLRQVD